MRPINKPTLAILATYSGVTWAEESIAIAPAGPLATPSASKYRRDSNAVLSWLRLYRARSKRTCIASKVIPSSNIGAAFCIAATISDVDPEPERTFSITLIAATTSGWLNTLLASAVTCSGNIAYALAPSI